MSLGGIDSDCRVVRYPIRSLLHNPSFTLFDDPYYHVNNKGCDRIIGSCNGLILLAGIGYLTNFNHITESKNTEIGSLFGTQPPGNLLKYLEPSK